MPMPRLDPPDELFELVDDTGRAIGRLKPRAAVHRDGDWHRAFHLWLLTGMPGAVYVLLQQRSVEKDTEPGRIDVAVGGHARPGEQASQGILREAAEELGLKMQADDLRLIGTRRLQRSGSGWCDREFQEIFAARLSAPIETLRPNPREVAALVLIALGVLLDRGKQADDQECNVRYWPVRPDGTLGMPVTRSVRWSLFVPAPDGYWVWGPLRAAAALNLIESSGDTQEK